MVDKSTITGLIGILVGWVLFEVSRHFESFQTIMAKYKWFVLIAALIIYSKRDKIAEKIIGRR